MIIGNYASGGTVLYQILVSVYKVNYIDNISKTIQKSFLISNSKYLLGYLKNH